MKVYSFTQTRQDLAEVLTEARDGGALDIPGTSSGWVAA
jgi:hypothetical protein